MTPRSFWLSIAALALTSLAPDARAETCTLIKTFDEEIGKLTLLRDDNNRREWLLIEYLRTETGKRESKATTSLKDWQASKSAEVAQASRDIAAVKMGPEASFDEESEDCRALKKVLTTYQSVESRQKDLVARFYTKDFPFLETCDRNVDGVIKLQVMRDKEGANPAMLDALRSLLHLSPAANVMLNESLAVSGPGLRHRQAYFGLRCIRDKQRKPIPALAAVAPALEKCEVKDWFALGLCLRESILGAAASNP